jgi:hypothetical protein
LRAFGFSRRGFATRADADRSRPRSPFPLEIDADTNLAQEGCRPAQPARKRPRAFRPGLRLGDPLARQFGKAA